MCGILCDKLIGPYSGMLNGDKYRLFLYQELSQLLENLSIRERTTIWLPHYSAAAKKKKILDGDYPNR